MKLTHGSAFAGIGGFDLGFQRAGIETIWQIEIDPFCRRVLRTHFPNAKRFENIKWCGKHNLTTVDILSGGFPCQDISNAGKRMGIEAEHSGLWSELYRLICELQPKIVIVENVAALLTRGIERVLGDLAQIGYDAEWDCFRASNFGAPHERERVFIIAYPNEYRLETHTNETILRHTERGWSTNGYISSMGCENVWTTTRPIGARPMGVGNGIPSDVDRLRALGNSVVPQVAEWIGRAIFAKFSS